MIFPCAYFPFDAVNDSPPLLTHVNTGGAYVHEQLQKLSRNVRPPKRV